MTIEKYHFALKGTDGCIFDEMDFESIEEGRKWASGRGSFHNVYDNKHYRYEVMIFTYTNNPLSPLAPYESYLES